MRWSLGDWKYQGIKSGRFDAGWNAHEQAVTDACMDEDEDEETFMTPTQQRFMKAACRVLIRLEEAQVFESLNRTADFMTYVADHDEADNDSWERLSAVRRESEAI